MHVIARTPGLLRLFGSSIIARLPVATFSIGLLVHAEHLTGSFAAAGVVAGANAAASGVGAPLLGRLVDRRGQTRVLLVSALACTAALAVTAALPDGAPLSAIVLLAVVVGLATPPLGACLRTLFPVVLHDPAAVRAAYAFEAAALELTYISGPAVVLALGALWSTGAALALTAALLLTGTVLFATQSSSRRWRPAPHAGGPRGHSLRAPAMRTLVLVFAATGVLLGAVEIAVTVSADRLHTTASAGPLLALWGLGSLIGGVVAARFGGGASTAAGLVAMLMALASGHLALVAAAGSLVALAAVLLVAGAAIAPLFATVYGMVDDAAPAGTVTEAFAWLSTALGMGVAVGAAGAGAIADAAGPQTAFALAGAAGAVAALLATTRAPTLARPAAATAC